ncbi:hypothetical protein [Chitinophaga ginsengisoli]|uniref:Adhesin domain-containing protein n=1 Tax=Chitinophaga ginsengisoli TaxID=363837 RepID=A0A2P8GDT8_9BACT|nr:hypothetical protein [Chitinophaga ginsengisoli]PSL32149.1 hypothetical protein CLV42_104452 [Chitinophaga ginsengisoli]
MKEKFSILLFLLLPILTYGKKGDSEFKKVIVKEFSTNPGTNLSISNKYGKIVVHTWQKNEVKATITITGFGKSVEEATAIVNMVDISMNNSGNNASLQTDYNPSSSGNRWFSWGGKKDSKDYVNIDYELYIPERLARLSLENNFGDIITDVLSFPTSISMNYCNYDIKEAERQLDLSMNYCDRGRIGKAETVNIRANYSNLKSDAISSLVTRSNYCEYNLGTVNSLSTSGNYDEYNVNKVGSFSGKNTYTNFRITEVQTEINSKLVYGDFSAKTLGTGFKNGEFQLTYTDVKLGVPQRLGLHIKVQLNRGDVKTGELSLKNVVNIKKNSQLTYTASTSSADDRSPSISVNGVYSDIDFESR